MILKGAGAVGISCAKGYASTRIVKPFSYMSSIGRRDEQNVLKFDLGVFNIKHKVEN